MHYQDLGSARHQYGISVLVTQMLFTMLFKMLFTSGNLAKRRLFSQANFWRILRLLSCDWKLVEGPKLIVKIK